MSGASISALPGVQIASDRRAFLLNEMAASFDRYVADYGHEPEVYMMVLGGIRLPSRLSWTTQGESEGHVAVMLAVAQATIFKEIVSWR